MELLRWDAERVKNQINILYTRIITEDYTNYPLIDRLAIYASSLPTVDDLFFVSPRTLESLCSNFSVNYRIFTKYYENAEFAAMNFYESDFFKSIFERLSKKYERVVNKEVGRFNKDGKINKIEFIPHSQVNENILDYMKSNLSSSTSDIESPKQNKQIDLSVCSTEINQLEFIGDANIPSIKNDFAPALVTESNQYLNKDKTQNNIEPFNFQPTSNGNSTKLTNFNIVNNSIEYLEEGDEYLLEQLNLFNSKLEKALQKLIMLNIKADLIKGPKNIICSNAAECCKLKIGNCFTKPKFTKGEEAVIAKKYNTSRENVHKYIIELRRYLLVLTHLSRHL